jgi:hypothetical protein
MARLDQVMGSEPFPFDKWISNDNRYINKPTQTRVHTRGKSTPKNTRNDEFSAKLFEAISENNFELAKALIDGGKVEVNIMNDCGDTSLITTCRH